MSDEVGGLDDCLLCAAGIKHKTCKEPRNIAYLEGRLAEVLKIRAEYHGHEEFGRAYYIVKVMDRDVSDLEKQIADIQSTA